MVILGPDSGARAADLQVIWTKILIRAERAGPQQGIKAIPIVFSRLLGGKRARGGGLPCQPVLQYNFKASIFSYVLPQRRSLSFAFREF